MSDDVEDDVFDVVMPIEVVPAVSPREAVVAFAAWMTGRSERVTFSRKDEAGRPAQLVKEFCDHQGWSQCRDDYTKYLKSYPSEVSTMVEGVELVGVVSSNVWGVGYQAGAKDDDGVLYVAFISNDFRAIYAYTGVRKAVFEELRDGESPGRSFIKRVKDQYQTRRVQ